MKKISRYAPCLLSVLMAGFISCSKSEPENRSRAESAKAMDPSAEQISPSPELSRKADIYQESAALNKTKKSGAAPDLRYPFIAPAAQENNRMLEYILTLNYETAEFTRSRKELLNIASKYGFISKAATAAKAGEPRMNAELTVRAAALYDALNALDSIGTLTAENITAVDHTENMELQTRRSSREQIRTARRNAAAGQTATAARNYPEIERALSESEDKLDTAAHEQWKIRDRISWARVSIIIEGPPVAKKIEVPAYYNALMDLANGLLYFLYVLIVTSPLIIIGALIWFKRKSIAGFFSSKK